MLVHSHTVKFTFEIFLDDITNIAECVLRIYIYFIEA